MPELVSRDGGCCFDLLRIKTGTYIVGAIELFIAVVGLFQAVGNLVAHKHAPLMDMIIFALQIVFLIIYIFLTILLFYGIRNDQPAWVFMHVQASASIALCMIIWTILVIVAGLWWNLVYYLIVLALMIFFVFVEYRCYQYMRGV